eukprot:369466-Pleurochrysis_carterae.AAC.3
MCASLRKDAEPKKLYGNEYVLTRRPRPGCSLWRQLHPVASKGQRRHRDLPLPSPCPRSAPPPRWPCLFGCNVRKEGAAPCWACAPKRVEIRSRI